MNPSVSLDRWFETANALKAAVIITSISCGTYEVSIKREGEAEAESQALVDVLLHAVALRGLHHEYAAIDKYSPTWWRG